MKKKDAEAQGGRIAENKRARFDYHVDERLEAGIELQGWEVKALRQGRIAFGESYAIIKNGEMFLFGAQISPLISASTHVVADKMRTRKLLLHKNEILKWTQAVERKGYTVVPLTMYFKQSKIKVQLGLAKGKQEHDKRADEKTRDWQREKSRLMRRN
jgi:SsrA-binding protein